MASIISALTHLPQRPETAEDKRSERAREVEVLKRRLEKLVEHSGIAAALDKTVADYNARSAQGVALLDTILSLQSYRLSYWRVASEEINYRRFFDVNALAAVRTETPAVFTLLHAWVLRSIGEGRITGLRLDHIDGLLDPADYLRRLNDEIRSAAGDDLYVVAEKILEPGEGLPPWPLAGTTGYDFIGLLSQLWNDPDGEKRLDAIYQSATGRAWHFEEVAYAAKQVIMRSSLASEITLLAQMLERIADADRRSRDFTLTALRRAIVETMAALGVYRTYVRADGSREPADARFIERAIARARRQDPAINSAVLQFLRDVLLLETSDAERRRDWSKFALRFQQVCSPVMAKAIEDTAFYVYGRLLSLNEVGGSPAKFSLSADDFHKANAERGLRWPLAMVSSSTHDTKRGEDIRARLAVLSEAPEEWRRWLEAWREMAAPLRTALPTQSDDEPAPSRDDEYFFFQTALAACPYEVDWASLADRFAAHLLKASKEAKLRTSWLNPDEGYERALEAFVRGLLAKPAFRESLLAARDTIAIAGACNSLAQTALKCAVPGVPDFYQGSELWNFDLVDPDNRRPVDYAQRCRLLAPLRANWQETWRNGAVKLHVTRVALLHRAAAPALFARGTYEPLVGGKNLVAFARAHEGARLVCVVPRFAWSLARGQPAWPLGEVWGEQTLTLPPGEYENAFTAERSGGRVALRDLFATFPLAWLIKL